MEFEAVIPPEGGNISPTGSESIMLESVDFVQVPEVRVAYDQVHLAQHLFYKGFLTEARKSQILQFFGNEPGKADLVRGLLEQVQKNAGLSIAQRLLELMATMEFSAAMKVEDITNILSAGNFSDFPIRLSYDAENKIQHFSYLGLLTEEIKPRIIVSLGAAPTAEQSNLLQELLDKIGTAGRGIFDPLFKSCIGKVFSTIEFKVAVSGVVLDTDTLDRLAKGEPAISGVYVEEGAGIQHLSYKGLLNNDEKERITGPLPEGRNLGTLLYEVQLQQVELIKYFHTGFLQGEEFDRLFDIDGDGLTNEVDLEAFLAPEERSRTELAMSLLPFLIKQSKSDFITGMLATDTGADPSMIKDLLSEPTLLSDPLTIQELEQEPDFVHNDRTLMEAFAETKQEGANTVFTTSDGANIPIDGTDHILMTSINTSAQKKNGTLYRPNDAWAVRFEGWFKVPTDGVYRFFAIRNMNGVESEFRLGAFPDPVIQMIAEEVENEAAGLAKLKGGIPYFFSFEARNLLYEDDNKPDVRLEIVGETLSRQDLGSLGLSPAQMVEQVGRARILVVKTFQIIKTLGLSGRETTFLLSHRVLFDDLDFGNLALHDTQADLPPKFFKALLRLLEYALLKKELSPDSDDLISVMENAGRTYFKYENRELTNVDKVNDAHFNQVAALMGRVAKAVRETAVGLNFATELTEDGNSWRIETPDLRTEKGIRRLWEALKIIEIFGLSAQDLKDATRIVAGDPDGVTIALNLRNAIKARYETEDWRKIVKNISDELRRKKRDALVAFIMGMDLEIFTMKEKLFEWFLVDPGMEPVVKTSRIRMALESVRRFVQRCLDGKETWVSPSAINKEQWKVRGRFRFWQANRRIFLHPENWLEPEFRDDKSHLYRELEASLLEGDVSDELVEDAFFKYLKGLEEISRLEIMTVYQETEDDPHEGWLHVVGRTHALPHKYFYRQYDGSEWTPWEPIDAEIEGDNIVAIVWKQRLHLFWVTFMEKSAKPEPSNTGESVEDMAKTKNPQITKKTIEAQLNWTDYFQGQWRSRQASEFMNAIPGFDAAGYTPDDTFVYAIKERIGDVEGAVRVHYHVAFDKIEEPIEAKYLAAEVIFAGYVLENIGSRLYFPFQILESRYGYYYHVNDTFVDDSNNLWYTVEGFGTLKSFFYEGLFFTKPLYVEIPAHDIENQSMKYSWLFKYYGAFRLLNKNCSPEIVEGGSLPRIPYSCGGEFMPFVRSGSRYWGKGALNAYGMTILGFDYRGSPYPHVILGHESPFPISLSFPDYPYEPAGARNGIQIIKADDRPFFYQDDVNLFFVRPRTLLTLQDVDGWSGHPRDEKISRLG